MPTRIAFTFGDGGKHEVVISDDLAHALSAALSRAAEVPTSGQPRFWELCASIAQGNQIITDLETWLEKQIAEADASDPNADRRALAAAASLKPTQLYRVLERNGRPRNRRPSST
jgi:hypothetical protein